MTFPSPLVLLLLLLLLLLYDVALEPSEAAATPLALGDAEAAYVLDFLDQQCDSVGLGVCARLNVSTAALVHVCTAADGATCTAGAFAARTACERCAHTWCEAVGAGGGLCTSAPSLCALVHADQCGRLTENGVCVRRGTLHQGATANDTCACRPGFAGAACDRCADAPGDAGRTYLCCDAVNAFGRQRALVAARARDVAAFLGGALTNGSACTHRNTSSADACDCGGGGGGGADAVDAAWLADLLADRAPSPETANESANNNQTASSDDGESVQGVVAFSLAVLFAVLFVIYVVALVVAAVRRGQRRKKPATATTTTTLTLPEPLELTTTPPTTRRSIRSSSNRLRKTHGAPR
jgi:hypothetical protein